ANVSLLQTYASGSAYSAVGQIDATGRTAGTGFDGIPANPGYELSQIGSRSNYYFSKRGEFRTDAFNSTDLATTYTLPLGRVHWFVQGNVINVFNRHGVVAPNTTVVTRRTGGAASGLKAFNPFTQTPIECPQGADAATCTAMNANWQKGPLFGTAPDAAAYQL